MTRPGKTVLGFGDFFGEMEDDGRAVFAEESLTFGNSGHVGRAGGCLSVFAASVEALHPGPLGHGDILWIKPFKIRKPVLTKYRFESLFPDHRRLLVFCSFPASFYLSATWEMNYNIFLQYFVHLESNLKSEELTRDRDGRVLLGSPKKP